MKVQLLDLTIRELVASYFADDDDGVVGYGARLSAE